MSCTGTTDCLCGCCDGTRVRTPQAIGNRPGLPSIAYRVGTWATFKESMLARLSSADYPALSRLRTRDDDDFSVALIDASAVVLEILAFYQERLANESYLGTAVQARSLVELARLIGYQPTPGVSASTYLAFFLRAASGSPPDPSAPSITIPTATQVQSVPSQNQKPETFETSAPILARSDWNAQPVQKDVPWQPRIGDESVYLEGTSTQLQPGDMILIVGDERLSSTTNNNWDLRVVTAVSEDAQNHRTRVQWLGPLGHGGVSPARKHPRLHVFRQRASLFGYNAPNPRMFDKRQTNIQPLLNSSHTEWASFSLSNSIDLDSANPKIVGGSWVALIHPDGQTTRNPSGFIGLFRAAAVAAVSRSDYLVSARITRIFPDHADHLADFPLRETMVLAQSEELRVAPQPLSSPLYGTVLDLEALRPDLLGCPVVALFGKRQKIQVAKGVTTLAFLADDGTDKRSLNPGDVLTITDPPPWPMNPDGSVPDWNTATLPRSLNVEDIQGRPGTLRASPGDFTLVASGIHDPDVSEHALVSSVINATDPFPHTRIFLKSKLFHCYDREATSVNANVGLATHGQTVTEVLGSGSASTPSPRFLLRQSPLSHVQAPTPTGRLSTLQVRANQVSWSEVPSLYQRGPSEQVFATLHQADASTTVLFGDGVEGSTLPTGQNNIVATYRVGSGSAGNVPAGSITTLMDRPLGVSGVAQPSPATGGQDAQTAADLRASAPLGVLTLGRAVSITDYQNFARTFAGISRAHAIWIPSGPGRGVFLTVAGVGGQALPPGNPTLANLVASLRAFGNPRIPITVRSFLETLFGFTADLCYDPAHDPSTVKTQALKTLASTYGFARRTFGQGVSADEVASVIQRIPGVTAVNVTNLRTTATSDAGDLEGSGGARSPTALNNWLSRQVTFSRPHSDSPTRICAFLPLASTRALPQPAEILVLDPNPESVILGTMT